MPPAVEIVPEHGVSMPSPRGEPESPAHNFVMQAQSPGPRASFVITQKFLFAP